MNNENKKRDMIKNPKVQDVFRCTSKPLFARIDKIDSDLYVSIRDENTKPISGVRVSPTMWKLFLKGADLVPFIPAEKVEQMKERLKQPRLIVVPN